MTLSRYINSEINMLKPIIERLNSKSLIYKKLVEVAPKDLGIRNRIRIFCATDPKGYYSAIFIIDQKSRVLVKDIEKFEQILQKLKLYSDHSFKYKLLMLDAPICSKALSGLKSLGWKVI